MGRCSRCNDPVVGLRRWCDACVLHEPRVRRTRVAAGVELGKVIGRLARLKADASSHPGLLREIESLAAIVGLKTLPRVKSGSGYTGKSPGQPRAVKAATRPVSLVSSTATRGQWPRWSPETLTARELAKRAGISFQTAVRYLRGESRNLKARAATQQGDLSGLSDLKVARARAGWTLQEVANRAKCSVATVCRVEAGCAIDRGTETRIRRVLSLGGPVGAMLNRTANPEVPKREAQRRTI